MKYFLFALINTALLVGDVIAESPFLIPEDQRKNLAAEVSDVIKKAEDDFDAVINGKVPIHAKYIDGSYTLDGGSSAYQGKGYIIILSNRMMKIGNVSGKLCGPKLKMQINGLNGFEVSQIRFIANEK